MNTSSIRFVSTHLPDQRISIVQQSLELRETINHVKEGGSLVNMQFDHRSTGRLLKHTRSMERRGKDTVNTKRRRNFFSRKISSGTISEINNNPVNPGSTGFTCPKIIDPPDIVYEQNYARRIIGISYKTVVHTVHPLLHPLRAFILE